MNRASKFATPVLAVSVLGMAIGCDSVTFDALESDVVIELMLVADEPLPPLSLSRTAGLEETFDFPQQAIRNARVQVSLRGGPVIPFTEHPENPGIYWPSNPEHVVEPGGTYDLSISVSDEPDPITGTTIVPGRFEILSATVDSAVYQADENLVLTISQSQNPDLELNHYVFVTEALDVRVEQLVPFAADVFEAADGDLELDDLRTSGSPIVSEGNFDINQDGTISIQYPWIGINFYGPNLVRLNTVDRNLFDFIRSQSVQQGGSSFGPGEIPNPIENIGGAHGVFGSLARATHRLTVLRDR